MFHPRPEIDYNNFFLFPVSCIFISPQEVVSLEAEYFYMALFENLMTAVNQETKGHFEQRWSAFLSIV